MAWDVYRSTDASAPVWNGTAASSITVLDAVLVNGYGAKAAAGWTKAFSGASKAAYRNGAASIARTYLRVQDDGPGAGGARESRVVLYKTMTDVDTGTLPVPTVAQFANGLFIRKSTTADSTARPWMILADDKTCIIVIQTGDLVAGVTYGSACYFGDIFSYLTADAMGAFISAREVENSVQTAERLFNFSTVLPGSWSSGYISGTHLGVYDPRALNAIIPGLATSSQTVFSGPMAYPNPTDGMIWVLGPHVLRDTGNVLRGHLRGINTIPVNTASIPTYAEFDQVNGTGDLSGKTFICHRVTNINTGTVASTGLGAFETSAVPFSV